MYLPRAALTALRDTTGQQEATGGPARRQQQQHAHVVRAATTKLHGARLRRAARRKRTFTAAARRGNPGATTAHLRDGPKVVGAVHARLCAPRDVQPVRQDAAAHGRGQCRTRPTRARRTRALRSHAHRGRAQRLLLKTPRTQIFTRARAHTPGRDRRAVVAAPPHDHDARARHDAGRAERVVDRDGRAHGARAAGPPLKLHLRPRARGRNT